MIAASSFLIYTAISAFFVFEVGHPIEAGNGTRLRDRRRLWHALFCIACFALLYAGYNVFCTLTSAQMGGDRTAYQTDFMGGTAGSLSTGLRGVYALMHALGVNYYGLLYFTTFVYVAVCVACFLNSGLNDRYALLFFVLTDAVFFSFTALKQIYACIFATILFTVVLKKATPLRVVICIAMVALACLFHNSAIILIPTYPLLLIAKSKKLPTWAVFTVIGLLALSVIFMDKIAFVIAEIVEPIKPSIAAKVRGYFGTDKADFGTAAFIKGLPFYLITALGILRRDKLRERIPCYDALLWMSALGAVLYLASFQSYWMSRATEFYFFPICIFLGQLTRETLRELKAKCPPAPTEAEQTSRLRAVCQNGVQLLRTGVRSPSCWLCVGIYASEFVVIVRWLALIYINYGGF